MYFLAKIKYSTLTEDRKKKTVKEEFIIDNVTYGGAEADMYAVLEGRVKSFTYDITKIKFNAIYDTFIFGDFYKVVIEETEMQEKGDDKKYKYTHLVTADDEKLAGDRARNYVKNWSNATEVVKIEKTNIVGVWTKNGQWQEDFKQRMHGLFDDGKHSPDANQLSMFNHDGSSKTAEGKVGDTDNDDEDEHDNTDSGEKKDTRSTERLEQDATDLLNAMKTPPKPKLTQEEIKANRQSNAAQQKRGGNGRFGSKVTGKLTLQSVDGTPEKEERGDSQSFPVIE